MPLHLPLHLPLANSPSSAGSVVKRVCAQPKPMAVHGRQSSEAPTRARHALRSPDMSPMRLPGWWLIPLPRHLPPGGRIEGPRLWCLTYGATSAPAPRSLPHVTLPDQCCPPLLQHPEPFSCYPLAVCDLGSAELDTRTSWRMLLDQDTSTVMERLRGELGKYWGRLGIKRPFVARILGSILDTFSSATTEDLSSK